jgi:hypothetical protein
LTVVTATMIVCATVLLSVVDVHRRHERALLENLAVSRTLLTVVFALPAIVGELGIRIVGSYRG